MTEPKHAWQLRLPLRVKLLAASSLLLLLPYLGYRYVNEMEQFLRDGLASTLLGNARAVAAAIGEQGLSAELATESPSQSDIYVHRLPVSIQVDGYDEDWRALEVQAEALHAKGLVPASEPQAGPGVSLRAGVHDDSLYLLVTVTDQAVVYAQPNAIGSGLADHLALTTVNRTGRKITHIIDTLSPGWARATVVIESRGEFEPVRRAYRIKGEWRETATGYAVELRLPYEVAANGLRIDVADANTLEADKPRVAASTAENRGAIGHLVLPSTRIESALRAIGTADGRRVWVVDRKARVRGRAGSLAASSTENPIHPLFRWLLTPPEVKESGPLGTSRLRNPVVTQALAGSDGALWQSTVRANASIVTAAHDIRVNEVIVGAVVVEENAAPIQTLRRQALVELFAQTLAVACLATLVLIWFASRVGKRLQRLRDEANAAIDQQGRVVGAIASAGRGDEISDLGESISGMLERLQGYNDYLEQLARRLSHELRTPIAVIRSSLDNLEHAPSDEGERYAQRAKLGLARLNTILSRMSEATRLEESLVSAERTRFDIVQVVRTASDSYARVWPETRFKFSNDAPEDLQVYGVPDLLVQALDKLVENAVGIGDDGEPIEIRISNTAVSAWIDIDNIGPALPDELGGKIFDSLVTARQSGGTKSDSSPHLGLGLFIVRLIAEFHEGAVHAFARPDGRGVVFRFSLPLSPLP